MGVQVDSLAADRLAEASLKCERSDALPGNSNIDYWHLQNSADQVDHDRVMKTLKLNSDTLEKRVTSLIKKLFPHI